MRSLLLLLSLAVVVAACGTSREAAAPAAPAASAPVAATPMTAPATAPMTAPMASGLDTVRAGRFDNGRMFTLDDAPREYFVEQYNFRPNDEWFTRARLGALRFATYCSASFVSPDGLILTNHHCARESVTHVGGERGQDFNRDGFYAASRAEEAPVEDLFVEQLISIEDVTERVNAAAVGADAAARQTARAAAIRTMQDEMTAAAGEDRRVQIVTLYSGGQYKAYTYRRYGDIRLVFAPETQMGYFGGDPDNFTYPRYSLDFSLFRAYGPDGQPLHPDGYFPFEPQGTTANELVFVLGNPGSTTRLQTVAQLEYRRDIADVARLNYVSSRERVYGDFIRANPTDPRTPELTDTYFGLGNSRKAFTGRVTGLQDPVLLARRAAAERDVRAALAARPDLQAEYGNVFDLIAANRAAARPTAAQARAFFGFAPGSPYNGAALNRALAVAAATGAPTAEAFARIEDQPVEIQQGLLAARFQDLLTNLGPTDPTVIAVLGGATPEAAAAAIMAETRLATAASAEAARTTDLSTDPAVEVARALLPASQAYAASQQAAGAELAELTARLARARFDLYGTAIPPDATFTLRLTDGVVKGYDYNGTTAPPYTTFYGLYDRYYSQCVATGRTGEDCPWHLPSRWLDAREDLDLQTPYNFVATTDIIGGNSGSPVVNKDLEVVGIAFDGNIEGLPGDYIFDDTVNRTVSLDVRAMLEVLDEVYGLDWIVEELTAGRE
ncbi:MAG TPA: S46 family peptidase [Rubricoccaceae bacterium]|jgi:hypothetical protein